jgi:hypothetical protein
LPNRLISIPKNWSAFGEYRVGTEYALVSRGARLWLSAVACRTRRVSKGRLGNGRNAA